MELSAINMDSKLLATNARIHTLKMLHRAKASHIGSCFSCADILAVLYKNILKLNVTDPQHNERDYFFMSKGHAGAVLFAILAEMGFFNPSLLESYCANGSILMGHTNYKVPGVELSTGSLGHALGVALGVAIDLKNQKSEHHSFVLLSDGELNEGSNLEAFIFAGHHKINKLTAVIDFNGLQGLDFTKNILDIKNLDKHLNLLGWKTVVVDGHNHEELKSSLQINHTNDKPVVVIANTVKGKGVSFMENKLEWHYKSPSVSDFELALNELEAGLIK